MSESFSYCSMAWPIQPTVLPRPKSATAPPERRQREIYRGTPTHEVEHFPGYGLGELDGGTRWIRFGQKAQQARAAGVAFRVERVPETGDALTAP